MADSTWLDTSPDAKWLDDSPDVGDAGVNTILSLANAPKPAGADESLGYGAAQSATFGFGDEIQGVIQATIRKLAERDPASWGALYESERDWARNRDRRASESNPKLFMAGNVLGGLATAGAGGGAVAAKGVPLLLRAARAGAVGAGLGGATGAGMSEADTAGGVAMDALGGAMLGAGVGGAVPLAGNVLARTLAKYAPTVGEKAVAAGRKALSGVGGNISSKNPVSSEAVQQAIDTRAIRPFDTVKNIADRLESQAETLGQQYGDVVAELEAQGIKGPNAVLLAQEITKAAQDASKNLSASNPLPRLFRREAADLKTKVDPTPFASKRLGLTQAENLKRDLQKQASASYSRDIGQKTPLGVAQEELASIYRQAVENEVSAQSALAPEAAARFVPVKQQLGRTLEALKEARTGAARAAPRKALGLTDTIVGGATGVATGNPAIGLASAVGHGIADRRLASTSAVLLRALERASEKAGRSAAGSPAASATVAEETALLDLLGLRGRPVRVPAESAEEPGK